MTHLAKSTTPSTDSAAIDRSALISAVPHLRAFARLLKEDSARADALVQEVIVHARAMRRRFLPGNGLKLWLFALAHHLHHRDLKNSRACRDARTGTGIPASGPSCGENSCYSQGPGLAFSRLRDEEREALILIEAASLTYAEAARVCRCPTETIKSRVSRARSRLLQTLGADEAETSFGSLNEVFV